MTYIPTYEREAYYEGRISKAFGGPGTARGATPFSRKGPWPPEAQS
jgi:hypothetical protein